MSEGPSKTRQITVTMSAIVSALWPDWKNSLTLAGVGADSVILADTALDISRKVWYNHNMSQTETSLPTRCFFDMLDNCVSYDRGDEYSGHTDGIHAPILSGLYDLPAGFNPVGKSAEDLKKYGSK